jgi:hypothetical protein
VGFSEVGALEGQMSGSERSEVGLRHGSVTNE